MSGRRPARGPMVGEARACRACAGWGNHHGDLPCSRCSGTGSEAVAEARREAVGERALERRRAAPTRALLERIRRRLDRVIAAGPRAHARAILTTVAELERVLGRRR